MKKYLSLIAVSALAFAACQKEVATDAAISEGNTQIYTYEFSAALNGPDTKMAVGTFDKAGTPAKWEEGDQVTVYKTDGTSVGSATISEISDDGNTAKFTLNTTAAPGTKVRIIFAPTVGTGYNSGKLPSSYNLTSKDKGTLGYTHAYSDEITLAEGTALSFSLKHALATVRVCFKMGDIGGTYFGHARIGCRNGLVSGKYTVDYASGKVTPAEGEAYSYIDVNRNGGVSTSSSTLAYFSVLPNEEPQNIVLDLSFKVGDKYYYYPFKFKGTLKAGELNVFDLGAVNKDMVSTKTDYYAKWLMGETFKIGDLEINRTNYPEAKLVKPEEFTNTADDYTKNFAGGLLFVDDITSKAVIDMSAASANLSISTASNGLVVVGRYKDAGSQTQFNVVDMRTRYDVAFLNLRLNLKRNSDEKNPGECLFEKNSSETVSSALRLVDCYLDAAQSSSDTKHNTVAVIRDRAANDKGNVAAPYSKVLVDNCIIKLTSKKGDPTKNAMRVYYLFSSVDEEEERSVSITNNVIFCEYPVRVAKGFDLTRNISNKVTPMTSPNCDYVLSNNTFVNFACENGIVYYGKKTAEAETLPVKSITADGNLGYFSNCTVSYASAKFSQCITSTAVKINGSNNYLSTENVAKSDGTVTTFQTWNMTGTNNTGSQHTMPFTSMDSTNGYFPVDRSVVTNGAGANYDTKGYISFSAE